jgi:hypothetical protein
MKNYSIFLLAVAISLFSCTKGGGGGGGGNDPDYDATITSVINTINNLDNVIENGNYSSLNNYLVTPVDADFLAGSIQDAGDSYTTFTITGLSKNNSSNPAAGTIILDGVGEFIVSSDPTKKHLVDLRITLRATSNYASASSYKIESIQQSNIRTEDI